MENHSYSEIIGNGSAPYINSLHGQGANFTNSHAVSHPSEPNYLALFAGTTEGLSSDSCPHSWADPNLGSVLLTSGQTFLGYSESMPYDGYTGCSSGNYARKHNPWVNFTNLPSSVNLTFGSFPSDYSQLPTVALVAPDLCSDMHDCSVATGDAWLQSRIDPYVQWAATHNSLLILTFDEDGNDTSTNQIATLFVGPMVVPGDYGERIDHYGVLRTLEDMYGVPPTGSAASASAIADVWQNVPVPPVARAQIQKPAPRSRRTVVVSRQ
jgi:acid phosphatase